MGESGVAIVGGGLVGCLHALYLAKHGFKVEVYEKRKDMRNPEAIDEGKSINLTLSQRGRNALAAIGCEDLVVSTAIPVYARMIHFPDGKISTQAYGKHGEAILSLDRQKLNEILLTKAEEHENVSLNFEHKLMQADFTNRTLIFQTAEGSQKVFNPLFTFGCDGAHSTVRQLMMRMGKMNYQQEYIEHGYKELKMSPAADGSFAMPENYLHIWPRNEFMMIALPNQDHSFTISLFMPHDKFESLKTKDDLITFFEKYFPDSIDKIGTESLVHDFFSNPTGSLVSVKCSPYNIGKHSLLLGDAAHAVVPFYGQGMNAGFEDCLVFDELLSEVGDMEIAAQRYSDMRWKDAHAIADLSKENYVEIRSGVNTTIFWLRRHLDSIFYSLLPQSFIPPYTMVAFSRIPYHKAVEQSRWQRKMVDQLLLTGVIAVCATVTVVIVVCCLG